MTRSGYKSKPDTVFITPKRKNDIYMLFLKGEKSIKKICLNKSFSILSKSVLCMGKGTKQTLAKN